MLDTHIYVLNNIKSGYRYIFLGLVLYILCCRRRNNTCDTGQLVGKTTGTSVEKKNQLDVIERFIALMICSTCFGYFYAHHRGL